MPAAAYLEVLVVKPAAEGREGYHLWADDSMYVVTKKTTSTNKIIFDVANTFYVKSGFSLTNRLFLTLGSVKKSIFFTLKILFFTLQLLFFTLQSLFFTQEILFCAAEIF
jgi:hypothetical protein